MKRTECGSCGCKWWNVPEKISKNLKVCPFCKAPLASVLGDRRQVFTMDVKRVVDTFGMEILADRKKFHSAFLDFYSRTADSKIMLETLESYGGSELMYKALKSPRIEQISAREKFVLNCPSFLILRDSAYELYDAFWDAIGGEPFTESHNRE